MSELVHPDLYQLPGQIFNSERRCFFETAERLSKTFNPMRIVNIGVWRGASCHCFRLGAPDAEIVGIDVMGEHNLASGARKLINMELIKRNSNYVVWERKIHILFVDGGHEYETVENDIYNYCGWVVPGGEVLFHDSAESEVKGAIEHTLFRMGDWEGLDQVSMLRRFRRVK